LFDLLAGARALEFSHQWPDSVGQYLADLGCEVIKIEPIAGSQTRGLWVLDGISMCHSHWNRSKKSLALDVKADAGRALVLEMIPNVDIVISGLRGGTLDRLGLGYPLLSEINPSIVYVSLSGWGDTGPYRALATNGAGFDGYAGLQPPDVRVDGLAQLPEMPGTRGEVHYGAVIGGMHAAMTAIAAWSRKLRTGQGACIDVAEADAAVAMRFDHLFWKLNFGIDDGRPTPWPAAVRTRYQYYFTADDKAVFLSPSQPEFWTRFCRLIGRLDLLDSERDTESERVEIAAIVRTRTQAEWVVWCMDNDVPCAPVHVELDDLLADPQFQARALTTEVADPARGSVRLFSTPVHVAGEIFAPTRAPGLGQHTDEVLASFGVPPERVAALRAAGVLG
jgi:crotonobetainyl-CoA:carnitine CoA-transferase CaiB-like acyl-CoA transferase